MSKRKKRRRLPRGVTRLETSGPSLVQSDNSKSYIIKQRELITLLTNHAAHQLGVDAPFIHHVRFHKANPADPQAELVTVTLEPIANVYEFPRKKR